MCAEDSNILKYTAIRLAMGSLENAVPIILTQHFEVSECAENTNKSCEQNNLVVLPASFKRLSLIHI